MLKPQDKQSQPIFTASNEVIKDVQEFKLRGGTNLDILCIEKGALKTKKINGRDVVSSCTPDLYEEYKYVWYKNIK